jgi:exonuclease VII large subunit
MESTPTACALALTSHWEQARQTTATFEQFLPRMFEKALSHHKENIAAAHNFFFESLHALKASVTTLEQRFLEHFHKQYGAVAQLQKKIGEQKALLPKLIGQTLREAQETLKRLSQSLEQYDPARVLRLGYSIIKNQTQVVKSAQGLKKGDILDIQLSDGLLEARVEKIM